MIPQYEKCCLARHLSPESELMYQASPSESSRLKLVPAGLSIDLSKNQLLFVAQERVPCKIILGQISLAIVTDHFHWIFDQFPSPSLVASFEVDQFLAEISETRGYNYYRFGVP